MPGANAGAPTFYSGTPYQPSNVIPTQYPSAPYPSSVPSGQYPPNNPYVVYPATSWSTQPNTAAQGGAGSDPQVKPDAFAAAPPSYDEAVKNAPAPTFN